MMSNSPISRLDNDILLDVFDLITTSIPRRSDPEPDSHRPITVVRVASQVCQQWRKLLLESRWIWGRILDFDVHDGPQKIEWLEEVFRRAGSAPLWIHGRAVKATVGSHSCNTKSFFIQLLKCWERIERLSVVVIKADDPDDERNIQDILSYFMCRAPILKAFHISFQAMAVSTLHPGPSQSLFADYAPLLREMESTQIAYKPDSPWLSNIREISSFPKNLNLNDFFVLLQHTPLIERFSINEDMSWTDQVLPTLPKCVLRNLSSITVCANPAMLATILNHFSPGRLSSLSLSISGRGPNDLGYCTSLTESLPLYVSNYFTSNLSTTVLFCMVNGALDLCDVTGSNPLDDGFKRLKYKFSIGFRTIERSFSGVVASLLDSFALAFTPPSLFRTITQIQIPLLQLKPTLIPKLYSMLMVFRHVTYLQTNDSCSNTLFALSCLDNADGDHQHVLFPSLTTLGLISFDKHPSHNVVDEHLDLTPFLKRRKNIGFPLTKLDLTSCEQSIYGQDLRELEDVHGLEVVWIQKQRGDGSGEIDRLCSYVCGTGDPEQLEGIL